jgi:hypothetical protein
MTFPKAGNLDFPRMGSNRELKFALERFWSRKHDEAVLLDIARELRETHWHTQQAAGIERRLRTTSRSMIMCSTWLSRLEQSRNASNPAKNR